MKRPSIYILACLVSMASIVFFACSKEKSFESGLGLGGFATGSLLDSMGDCQDIQVFGTYTDGIALNSTNYAMIKVNFTAGGKYIIETDTMNGYWFRDSGFTSVVGPQTIRLQAFGTPILPIYPTFTVAFDDTYCSFSTDTSIVVVNPPSGTQGDYFPMNAGNNYGYNVAGTINDTVHFEALIADSTIGANTYRKFKLQRPATVIYDTLLFRKSGNNYYQLGKFDNTGATVEYIVLKDDQPAGTTWESPTVNVTYLGANTQAKVKQTIIAKDIPTSVGSNTFDSVIQVQQDYMYKIGTTFQTVNTGVIYYAKKVGIVSWDLPTGAHYSVFRWKVYL